MLSKSDDIVDAEFETLERRPKAPKRSGAADGPASGLGLFKASPASEKKTGREPMPLPLFAAIATMSACASFLVAGGHVIFTRTPSVGESAASVTSIVLEDVTTRVDTSGGRATLIVRAGLANTGSASAPVPAVAITFDRPDGSGSVTHRIVRDEWLVPGDRMTFTSRIPAGDYAGIAPRVALAPAH